MAVKPSISRFNKRSWTCTSITLHKILHNLCLHNSGAWAVLADYVSKQ